LIDNHSNFYKSWTI